MVRGGGERGGVWGCGGLAGCALVGFLPRTFMYSDKNGFWQIGMQNWS